MKNKQIIFIFCIFFIITTLPVTGFSKNIIDNNLIINTNYLEDYPGYMNTIYPRFFNPKISQIEPKPNKNFLLSINYNIIDVILQLDDSIVLQYLEDLTAFGPRVTGTPQCYAAGEYIYNQFESMGLEVRYHNWSYWEFSDRNVEATLYASNSSSDEIYVICAHFDTVPESPGADDDGSGVAAVLAAANIMSKYDVNHTIRFVTFSGEEEGLFGSYKYVEEAKNNGDNITCALNIDMIGYAETKNGGNNVTIRQDEESIWLTDLIINVSQLYNEYINLEIIPQFDPYGFSDHYSFWQFGYNAIQYREFETNPYYHTSGDTIENMNISYSVKCSKLALATLATLAAQPCEINLPPNPIFIYGPSSGKAGTEYTYTFNSVDPDGDDVFYFIDWGDGAIEDWDGPHPSGVDFEIGHSFPFQKTFTIKAKAKDVFNSESNWSYFDVEIPRTRATKSTMWLQSFLERFPLLERLLNLLLL